MLNPRLLNIAPLNQGEDTVDSLSDLNDSTMDVIPIDIHMDGIPSFSERGRQRSVLPLPMTDDTFQEYVATSDGTVTAPLNQQETTAKLDDTDGMLYRYPFAHEHRRANGRAPIVALIFLSFTLLLFSLGFCSKKGSSRIYVGGRGVGEGGDVDRQNGHGKQGRRREEIRSIGDVVSFNPFAEPRRLSEGAIGDLTDAKEAQVRNESHISAAEDTLLAEFCAETSALLMDPEYLPDDWEWKSLFAALGESTEELELPSSPSKGDDQTSISQSSSDDLSNALSPSSVEPSTACFECLMSPFRSHTDWTGVDQASFHSSAYSSVSTNTGDPGTISEASQPISSKGSERLTLIKGEQLPLPVQPNVSITGQASGHQLADLLHIFRVATGVEHSKPRSKATLGIPRDTPETPKSETALIELIRVPLHILLFRKEGTNTRPQDGNQGSTS